MTKKIYHNLIIVLILLFANLKSYSQVVANISVNGTFKTPTDTIKICRGTSINFFYAAINAISANWTFTGALPTTSTSTSNQIVAYNTNGLFVVKLVVANGVLLDSTYTNVLVDDTKPIVDFTFNPNNQCANVPINFNNLTTGAASYFWNFKDNNNSLLINPVYQFLNAVGLGNQTYNVSLTATSSIGCVDSVIKPVTVIRVPDVSIGNADAQVTFSPFNGIQTFRRCTNLTNYNFTFINTSPSIGTITQYKIEWGDASPDSIFTTWPAGSIINHTYSLGNTTLTISATGPNGCIGIKKYNFFLGSNPSGGIASAGNTTICSPQKLKFFLTNTATNPPSTIYSMTYSDGSLPDFFNHPAPDSVEHLFVNGSCGFNAGVYNNSFIATFKIENPCGSTEGSIVPIYVSSKPGKQITFTPDRIVCPNIPVTIQSIGRPGYLGGGVVNFTGGTTSNCTNTEVRYWTITPNIGYTINAGSLGSNNGSPNFLIWTSGTQALNVTFNQPGTYTFNLYSANSCGIDSVVNTICVRSAPVAAFDLSGTSGCLPTVLSLTNQTTPTAPSCAPNRYTWQVNKLDPLLCSTGVGSDFIYQSATNATSTNPQIQFLQPGKYVIRLFASVNNNPAVCSITQDVDTFIVKAKPKITINPIPSICQNNTIAPTINFSNCYGETPATFDWTFTNGIPATSNLLIPTPVLYNTVGLQPILLTATNECGNTTATANVNVTNLPIANAGVDKTICSGQITPIGQNTGLYTYSWTPNTGLSNANIAAPNLNFIYNGPSVDTTLEFIVNVSQGANCAKKDTVYITVKRGPIVNISPTLASICIGDSVKIYANGADNYIWSPLTNATLIAPDTLLVKPTITLTYSVTGSLSVTGCDVTKSSVITVKPYPNTNAGPDATVCISSNSVPLTGTPASGIWTGTQITGAGIFNPSAAGLGNFNQFYTYNLNGCTRQDTVVISVISNPIANAGADTTVCSSPSSFSLFATPTGGTWTGSGFVTGTGIFTPTTPNTYNLTYNFGSGTCTASATKKIIVQPGIANNNISANQTICNGAIPATLTGTLPTGGNGIFIYTWQESLNNITWNNIASSNVQNYSPPALLVSKYFRRLVSTNLCLNQPSLPILINFNPDAKALFAPTQILGCAPFSITNTIINYTAFPLQNVTYNWYANNILIGSNTSGIFPGYTINNPLDSVKIKLEAISLFGCKNDSLSFKFFTQDKPVSSFTQSVDSLCGPDSVFFVNTSYNIPYFNFLWDFGTGVTSNQTQPGNINFPISPLFNDTTYKITLKSFKDCDTSVTIKFIKVKSKPKALFAPSRTEGCSPMQVTFNSFPLGLTTSYSWDFGDGSPINTSSNPVNHTYTSGVRDTFYCKFKVTNNCGTDSLSYAIIVNPNNIALDFAVNATEKTGCAPHTVNFINNSNGANTYTYKFNDGSLPISSNNGVSVTPHTFINPGTYIVELFGQNTCTDTADFETIIVHPTPTSNFSISPNPACINDTVFTSNNSTPIVANYLWNFGDGTTSVLFEPKKIYTTSGNYPVSLIASILYPQNITCSDTTFNPISIVDTFTTSFTNTPLTGSCAPFTVKVKNSVLGNPLTVWNFGDGTPNQIGDSTSHTYLLPGSYIITMISTSSSQCKFKATKPVFVSGAYGSLSFTPANICVNQTVNFTAVSSTATQYIYVFGNGDSATSTSNIFSYTYTQAGTYLPYIYFVDINGCKVVRKYLDTIRVDSVRAGFKFEIFQNCGNTTIQFIDTSYSYFGLVTHSWQLGSGATSNLVNTSQTYTNNGPVTITKTVSSLYGCSAQFTTLVPFVVWNKPVSNVIVPSDVCAGTILNLTANTISNDPINTYNWQFSNGTIASGQNVNVVFINPGPNTIRLITTTINNCADTQIYNINIRPRPAVTVGADERICLGQSVQLNATGIATSFTWTPIGGLSCNNCSNPIAGPTSTTTYVVTATNAFNCINTDTIIVSVVQPFNVMASQDDTICIGQSVQLQASGAFTYLWLPPTNLSNVNISNPIATPINSTNYQVIGRDEFGCFLDTAVVKIVVSNFPIVNIGPDTILVTGATYNIPFNASFGPFANYNWTNVNDLSCNNCPNPILTATSDKCYSVAALNIFGCVGRDTFCVKTICNETQLFIPNAFSPDGDGINDFFFVKSKGISNIKSMRIYNRWGQIVFEKANIIPNIANNGWDGRLKGKVLPPDVFIYVIEATCSNGTPFSYKGDVTLIQ